MKLLIPPDIKAQLVEALIQVGKREIGGILMGEHVGPDTFRVKDLTIQRRGGTFATFVRLVAGILAPLRAFFEGTKHDYTRFNYLGEWHSHHSFALMPSGPDHTAMQEIVMDAQVGAHFVLLLLVKLDKSGIFHAGVTVYQPYRCPYQGEVHLESPA